MALGDPPSGLLDDIPVDLADVLAADLGKTVSEREMDGAVDLLVEEHVLHVTSDPGVAADAELAQASRPLVAVEHLEQERLVRLGRGVDHDTTFEAQAGAA